MKAQKSAVEQDENLGSVDKVYLSSDPQHPQKKLCITAPIYNPVSAPLPGGGGNRKAPGALVNKYS